MFEQSSRGDPHGSDMFMMKPFADPNSLAIKLVNSSNGEVSLGDDE